MWKNSNRIEWCRYKERRFRFDSLLTYAQKTFSNDKRRSFRNLLTPLMQVKVTIAFLFQGPHCIYPKISGSTFLGLVCIFWSTSRRHSPVTLNTKNKTLLHIHHRLITSDIQINPQKHPPTHAKHSTSFLPNTPPSHLSTSKPPPPHPHPQPSQTTSVYASPPAPPSLSS